MKNSVSPQKQSNGRFKEAKSLARQLTTSKPILLISHQATLTGAPAVIRDLGASLSRLGIEVVFFVIDDGPEINTYRDIGTTYLSRDFNNDTELAAKEIIEKHRPFAAICNTITTTHMAQKLKNADSEIKCIAWIHEMPTIINSFFGGRETVIQASTTCDHLAFGCEFALNKFASEYLLERSSFSVIPYARAVSNTTIERLTKISPEPPHREEPVLIIGCGTAEPRKGLDIFVRIAKRILDAAPMERRRLIMFEWHGCPDYKDNYVEFCKLDAREMGIANYIAFKPVSDEFSNTLDVATVFLLTSREDPYPLVILDSMARGVPFVCFKGAGGAADLASLGAGLAVNYGDEEAFAKSAIDIALDSGIRRRFSLVGIKRILNNNHWTQTATRAMEILLTPQMPREDMPTTPAEDNDASVTSPKGNKTRALVISFGPPPLQHIEAVEGGGLRCWWLAKGLLLSNCDINVTLAYPGWYDGGEEPNAHQGVTLTRWNNDAELVSLCSDFDAIIISYCYGNSSLLIAEAIKEDQVLVLDCYVPIHTEMCARRSNDREGENKAYNEERLRWEAVLKLGDIFLCSNENQLHYYRGVLYQIGRLNPLNYEEDPIVIAPYGIGDTVPDKKKSPIKDLVNDQNVRTFLWFGGVYPWFNIKPLFDAVIDLNKSVACALVIVGVRNPFNGHPDFVRLASEIEALASSSPYNRFIHLADWVNYNDRADWYLDCDVTVMISEDGVENDYAWRTRLVDFLWSGTHVATSGQDLLSRQMINAGAATKLNLASPEAIGESLLQALNKKFEQNEQHNSSLIALGESLSVSEIGKRVGMKITFQRHVDWADA